MSTNPYLTETIDKKVARYTSAKEVAERNVERFTKLAAETEDEQKKAAINAKLQRSQKNVVSLTRILGTLQDKAKVESEIRRLSAKLGVYEQRVTVLKTKIKNLQDWLPELNTPEPEAETE